MTATPTVGVAPSVYHPDTQSRIKAMEKALTAVEAVSGNRLYRVFEDFLDLTLANLTEIPRIFTAGLEGTKHEDSEETQKVYERLRGVYPKERGCWDRFSECFNILLDSAEEGYQDVIGSAYMAFGWPSKGAGQYFSPFNIAKMMAEMTCFDVKPEVDRRLKEAIAKSPLATGMLLSSITIQDPKIAEAWFIARIIPAAAEHYEPVTVCDPCVGSGIMLLAAASSLPPWMSQLGLVQFYGQDIDATCVKMAKINVRLYGLNGVHAPAVILDNEMRLRHWEKPEEEPAPLAPAQLDEITSNLPDVDQDFMQLSLLESLPVYEPA